MTTALSVDHWERRAEGPLAIAAVVFLAGYAVPIVWPGVDGTTRQICSLLVVITWVLFGVDYLGRLAFASDRSRFVRGNLFDLAVLALPVLRPLRLLRLVTLLSILNRTGSRNLRGRVVTYVTAASLLLVLCGGLAITDAERGHPEANIENFGDGLWWAVATMTTVGYGDRYPVTTTGRFVSVALMLAGIALLGVVTATLASWLVERVAEANDDAASASRADVQALAIEVRELREDLARAKAGPVA